MIALVASITSCKKDTDAQLTVKSYTIPTTYNFANVNTTKATQRANMAVELDTYLKTANTGTTIVPLDVTKITNMYNNTNNPFASAVLNTSGINLKNVTTDASLYKAYADSVVLYNTATVAGPGVGGTMPRNTGKIVVGPRGIEYGQAYLKGIMGGLFFKEAVRLLTEVKSMSASDTAKAQASWDEAFGYLAVPVNYDSSLAYASTDPNRPLLWGAYLGERGREIQAGGTIFNAFLKGRAAIGGYDVTVRNEQADIILTKWEQLSARAGWVYTTMPASSANVGNYGAQLHALSEGFGFILALKYRPSNSRLTAANFETLNNIFHKDFYALLNQPGFTDLVNAQNILKTTYGFTN